MNSFTALLLISCIATAICQTPFGFSSQPVGATRNGPNRSINIISAPGSIGIRAVATSKVGNMTDLDAVRAGASLTPFPTMTYSYFTSSHNVTDDITDIASAHFSFVFRFAGIIEYVESGANDGFQPSEDTVVSYYSLRKNLLGWKETTSAQVNNNGETVLVVTAETRDEVVKFTLVFAGNRTVYENKTLDGNNYKFSVTINYGKAPNYTGRNDTSIAIVTIASSKKSVKDIQRVDDTSSSVEVPSSDSSITGLLSWDTQIWASRNGTRSHFNLTNSVDVTIHNDTDALTVSYNWATKVIYHSISLDGSVTLGNAELYWDPEVGADINYGSDSTSTTTSPSSGTTNTAPSSSTTTLTPSAAASSASSIMISIAVVVFSAIVIVLA